MTIKRTKKGVGGGQSTSPREIVVQRLSSEPDNRQTYKLVQPREFVDFSYEELSLENLKTACAEHFNLPAHTCDVLVSNKGPSCSNINQIPHRKDKVYLVRFVVDLESEDLFDSGNPSSSINSSHSLHINRSVPSHPQMQIKLHSRKEAFSSPHIPIQSSFPASVSIDTILGAGKFVKPISRKKLQIDLESFDLSNKEWIKDKSVQLLMEENKFSSGAFRDAFKAFECGNSKQIWVLKKYNDRAKAVIQETLHTSIEMAARKQLQMHTVARELTKRFTAKIPREFGDSFYYNHAYYATYTEEPITVEEYVPGKCVKYINNDGSLINPQSGSDTNLQQIFEKAQCLVHYTYISCDEKLMLLDIQGSNYTLYDPEISTRELFNEDEVLFGCGNLSIQGIESFLSNHKCNRYCRMMIPVERQSNTSSGSSLLNHGI